MKKIIYSFLLLLLLTRSSECASSEKKEIVYKYWDNSQSQSNKKRRAISFLFDERLYGIGHKATDSDRLTALNNLKNSIVLNLKEDDIDVNKDDIEIYLRDNARGAKLQLVDLKSISLLVSSGNKLKIDVFKKTDNMQEQPNFSVPFGVTVTLCNCEKNSITKESILDNQTIGDVKEAFGLSDNIKLLKGTHIKTLDDTDSLNKSLGDQIQLSDIMNDSDTQIILFAYPEGKIVVNGEITVLKKEVEVIKKSKVDQFKLPLLGLIGILSLCVMVLAKQLKESKNQLLNASKSNRKKKNR